MKRLLLVGLLLASIPLFAQELNAFNESRVSLTQNGMIVLGSWAGLNIISSPILANQTTGSNKYFHRFNGYWNVVNLIIAGAGFYGVVSQDISTLSLSESLTEQQKIEKMLLFNAGLDIAYLVGGFYLRERSFRVTKNEDRLKGYGESLILQGAWLFTFDAVFYFIQAHNGKNLLNIVDGFALMPSGFYLSVNL